MVYCTKCGEKNEDNAQDCVKCGAPIQVSRREKRGWEEELERGAEEFGKRAEDFGKRMENECFGLPHGGAIIGLIFGAFIIIIGISLGLGIDIGNVIRNTPWIGAAFTIIVGLLIIAGALYGLSRRRS
jgi:hypothetical protein